MKLTSTWLLAAVGAIGTFWQQFQGFLARAKSIFIVRADMGGMTSLAVMKYLWKHFYCSKYGTKVYGSRQMWVKTNGEHSMRHVGFELVGSMTFYLGWMPLFVSRIQKNNSPGNATDDSVPQDPNEMVNISISCIRGMFDIKKLIQMSLSEMDSGVKKKGRYSIHKIFGSANHKQRQDRGDVPAPEYAGTIEKEGQDFWVGRPIGYTADQLQSPKPPAPFGALAYPKEIRDYVDYLKQWKKSEKWYKQRNIPWRMGTLLHGKPGTGKSSFARAVAQDLDIPVHVFDMSTMSNYEMVTHWRNALGSAPAIVLLEDIDRIFDGDKNQNKDSMWGNDTSLTMDCLLNCLSGVEPSDGLLVMVTANDVKKLDPALGLFDEHGVSSRPGRLDKSLEFKNLDEEGRQLVAERILEDHPEKITLTIIQGRGESGAQFTKRCADLAVDLYWKDFANQPPGDDSELRKSEKS